MDCAQSDTILEEKHRKDTVFSGFFPFKLDSTHLLRKHWASASSTSLTLTISNHKILKSNSSLNKQKQTFVLCFEGGRVVGLYKRASIAVSSPSDTGRGFKGTKLPLAER